MNHTPDGLGGGQTAAPIKAGGGIASASAEVSPELLTDRQAAAMMGVGERTFLDLIDEPWMPLPIPLGPRLRKWSRAELLDALHNRAPRGGKGREPAQLRRARIERMKSTGTPAAA